MQFDDYTFPLPQELIAHAPLADRDAARLVVLRRATGVIEHAHMGDLPDLLGDAGAGERGDRWQVVLNESRVTPSTLELTEEDGRPSRVAFGRDPQTARWQPLGDPADVVHPQRTARNGSAAAARLAQTAPETLEQALAERGAVTLPRYLTELASEFRPGAVPAFYDTVYGRVPGSVAPPSGGINLSRSTLAGLQAQGVPVSTLVHHVGAVTFRHPTVPDLASHRMEGERFAVSPEAAEAIVRRRAEGRKLLAVGTTSTRALEHVARTGGLGEPGAAVGRVGVADLFITPAHRFGLVDGLLTGLHAPRTTLFVLVCSLAGRELVLEAYAQARAERYRWYTLGDSMLVL